MAEGATPLGIERAEAAAWEVFEAADVDPREAAWANFKFEGAAEFDLYGGLAAIRDEECALRDVWLTAIDQAATAFFGTKDYRRLPNHTFNFELVREPVTASK